MQTESESGEADGGDPGHGRETLVWWRLCVAVVGVALAGVLEMALVLAVGFGVGAGIWFLGSRLPVHLIDILANVTETVLTVGAILVGACFGLYLIGGFVWMMIRGFRERRRRLLTAGPIVSSVLVLLQ